MGNYYVTTTAVDVAQQAVVAELKDFPSLVAPKDGRYVVVYPDAMALGIDKFSLLSATLSKSLQTAIFVASVFDDDIFYYELWVQGELKDRYSSENSGVGWMQGNAGVLCTVFKCSNPERIEQILKAIRTDSRYVFETDRHADLVAALGLPRFSVGCGYDHVLQGDCPGGLPGSKLIETPAGPLKSGR